MKRNHYSLRIRSAAVGLFAALLLMAPAAGLPAASLSYGPTQATSFSTGSIALSQSLQPIAKNPKITRAELQAISTVASDAVTSGLTRHSLARSGAAAAGGYEYVTQRSGYQSLTTDAERTLYDFIDGGVYQVADEAVGGYYPLGQISLSQSLSKAQIEKTVMAYSNDNPQVFWLCNAYSFGYRSNETVLQMYSYLSLSDCNAAIQKMNDRVQSIIGAMPVGLSQFDREEYLYDTIVKTCSYNTAAAQDTSLWQAFTAYGALTDGNVVCEGYSRSMQLLCSYAGIPCTLIRGTSAGVGHMWNAVNIDGNWYHIDLTWCDGSQPIYNYFNITDKVISQTRSIAPAASKLTDQQILSGNSQFNLFLPACTATKANYYIQKAIAVKDLGTSGDSTIVQKMTSEIQSGDTVLAFYIDASSNFTTVVNGLVKASPYKMNAYLKEATQAAGKTLSSASYVVDQANRGLEVCVAYQ
jgi:hypothetical protein